MNEENTIKKYVYHFKKTLYQFPLKYIPGMAIIIGRSIKYPVVDISSLMPWPNVPKRSKKLF
jgi:hypothetical protein